MREKNNDYYRDVANFINNYIHKHPKDVHKSKAEIDKMISDAGIKIGSWDEPSDHCYNSVPDSGANKFAEEIHLFEIIQKGKYKLLGENYPYNGLVFKKKQTPSETTMIGEWKNGKLKMWDESYQMTEDEYSDSICSIEENDGKISSSNLIGKEKDTVIKVRVNQSLFRNRLMSRYDSCCLCGMKNKHFLVASHIKPWSESSSEEKLDADNGLLLCPNHDILFDRGWITFDDDGKIIISSGLDYDDYALLNISSNMYIDVWNGNKKYLAYHRAYKFHK